MNELKFSNTKIQNELKRMAKNKEPRVNLFLLQLELFFNTE